MVTLEQAKSDLRAKLHDGARCPLCNQFAKIYRRKLHQGMASRLIRLYRLSSEAEWVNVNDIYSWSGFKNVAPNDFPYLKFWGLIDDKESNDADKRSSGFWRITDKGRAFVERRCSMPSHVNIYDARALGFSDKQTFIDECLGKLFSYRELMG